MSSRTTQEFEELQGNMMRTIGNKQKKYISTLVFPTFKDLLWIYYFPYRWRISGFAFSIS
jgi:hypothetical protein